MNIYLRNAGQRRQNSHDFPTGIARAKEPGAEASGRFGIKTGLPGKQLPPQLVKIIAGNGHMGVQPVFPNDGGGELKVLPGVEGFLQPGSNGGRTGACSACDRDHQTEAHLRGH